MSLNGRLDARIFALLTGAADHAVPQAAIDLDCGLDFTHGVGTDQANLVFSDQRTLGASASENLDIRGVLSDLLGTVLNMVKVKAVLIKASSSNVNNVVVGNDANSIQLGFSAITATWSIPPGGWFMVAAPAAGWSVTAGTGDIIKIANSAGSTSVIYDIVVLGTNA
jgi:hypothetical protein